MSEHKVNYAVTVHHEDDGSYWAEVDELPGCFASGESLDELWEALGEAVSLYLSSDKSPLEVKISNIEQVSKAEHEHYDAKILVH